MTGFIITFRFCVTHLQCARFDNDGWSRIVQGFFSVDSDDLTDVCYLEKVSLVDKLLDHRKEELSYQI